MRKYHSTETVPSLDLLAVIWNLGLLESTVLFNFYSSTNQILSCRVEYIQLHLKTHQLFRQFGNLARHSWGTVGAQLRHSWGTVGAQNWKLSGTIGAQLGHSWGIKLLGAQLGHSWGKTGWGTVEAQLGHNPRTKWRQFNLGHSWGTVGAHSGHTSSLDTVRAQLGHKIFYQ